MSTEYVNLDSTIQGLKDTDTVQERNKELILEFLDNIAAEGIGDSEQWKYIWCLKTAIAKFAPDDFILDDTEEKDIRRLMANVHRSDYSASTKNHMLVAVKRFYKYLNGGTYPDKVQFIKTTSEKDSPVSREDLFTEAELTRLLNELRKLRDKAFFKTLYESVARPGELSNCTIADVEFNDKGDFIHLQGEKGTPDRTNQLIESGQYLRNWIEMHPAGGNPHDPVDPTAPLWVKRKHHSCKHCDKTKQLHGDTDCSNFEPKEIEKMKYTAFYRAFKRACDRADIGDRRPYDLRHTRITEVAKYMGYEQLNKFANKEDLVEDLLQYAEQHIDIRRVCMDRGFFSGAVVNTMDDNDWKFIMPATRTSKIRTIIEEANGEKVQEYELNGSEKAKFNLVLREGKDGELKTFATNCGKLEILTHNLFDLYGRRWDIETGYRVQKNKFLPKTTSKNYNVRLFLFLFSELLYNCWMLVNVRISLELYGEIQEDKEITAKKFIHCLFEAFDEYG